MAILFIIIFLGLVISFPIMAIYNFTQGKWKRGLIFLGIFVLLLCMFLPNFFHARHCGQYTACESNLKNIGTALEMYSTDNYGLHPSSLESLVPRYLENIPNCPSAGKNTYSQSYRVSKKNDSYTVYCSGSYHRYFIKNHHANHNPGYPQYDSHRGLITDH